MSKARGAQRAKVNGIVFHQMANWLPEPERTAPRAAFVDELAQQSQTA